MANLSKTIELTGDIVADIRKLGTLVDTLHEAQDAVEGALGKARKDADALMKKGD